jgi:hypothetical protein
VSKNTSVKKFKAKVSINSTIDKENQGRNLNVVGCFSNRRRSSSLKSRSNEKSKSLGRTSRAMIKLSIDESNL